MITIQESSQSDKNGLLVWKRKRWENSLENYQFYKNKTYIWKMSSSYTDTLVARSAEAQRINMQDLSAKTDCILQLTRHLKSLI